MPRGNKRNEEKARKARESLIQTIAKIHDLEPTLGGKWQQRMVDYYVTRLAELLLYQSGFRLPSQEAMAAMVKGINLSLSR